MDAIMLIGMVLFAGFLIGEIVEKLSLPKVTGYIIAGLTLNPEIARIVPQSFVKHTGAVTDIGLAFIAFSVGGALSFQKVKKLGKSITYIAFFQAELTLIIVAAGMIALLYIFPSLASSWSGKIIAASIVAASLALPTDPSATLATIHEEKAEGEVTSTILGIAGVDDVLAIINFSICIAVGTAMLSDGSKSMAHSIIHPAKAITGAVLLGIIMGIVFNLISKIFRKETEGSLIVLVFAFIGLGFGLANLLDLENLLTLMVMGIIVTNCNPISEKIFELMERYTEELIFVLFFTLSAMNIKLSTLGHSVILLMLFVILRTLGKFSGSYFGAKLAGASKNIKKYTFLGLLPQGGIVIGLALSIGSKPEFQKISQTLIAVIIGSALIHEILGPIAVRYTVEKTNEAGKKHI